MSSLLLKGLSMNHLVQVSGGKVKSHALLSRQVFGALSVRLHKINFVGVC